MLFDNLFGMMTPAVTVSLLGGIVAFFTGLTAAYVRWERSNGKCLTSYSHL